MRITPAALLKIAQDTVTQRTRADRDLLAIYLHGSLLAGDPLLGGAADIDLFFIHNDEIAESREIVRITDLVHLDIAHHARSLYRQARDLRLHPWLGPSIYNCKILYDPQHFMDFTQASVRGQFNQPDNILSRARSQSEHARQIWLSFQLRHTEPGVESCAQYLKAVEHAANAIASLSGPQLTERRFLLTFPEKAAAVDHRGLYNGLLGLLGGATVDANILRSWIPDWQSSFAAVSQSKATARFDPCRLGYYLHAFEHILAGELPQDVLWPLFHSWTRLVVHLPQGTGEQAAWEEAGKALGLLGPAFFDRLVALDAYLDTIEELLDQWAQKNGLALT